MALKDNGEDYIYISWKDNGVSMLYKPGIAWAQTVDIYTYTCIWEVYTTNVCAHMKWGGGGETAIII